MGAQVSNRRTIQLSAAELLVIIAALEGFETESELETMIARDTLSHVQIVFDKIEK